MLLSCLPGTHWITEDNHPKYPRICYNEAMNKIITENLKGFEIKFETKPGVFSEKGLDNGTKLLVDNLEVEDNTLIADLGSGTGVVGIVCAKLNPNGHVHLLDDHLRSVELAKKNVELNNLKNVEVYLSDLFSAVNDRTYHQIFTNPPQSLGNEFLKEIITECFNHLKSKGILYLVVKKIVKSFIDRVLKDTFPKYQIISYGKEHAVIKASKS
ncbi:MAG: methyltransferase [Candidatus Daviesbacteria bacterium]|nr:methyltransferase [Candidatus Daviesbacteria bacterium]